MRRASIIEWSSASSLASARRSCWLRVVGTHDGRLSHYWRWRKLGWIEPLRRAAVAPREGDAQKAARRSYVTASLVCGRNPKVVSAEIGHTTTRMVVQVYDSFMNPAGNWPPADEIARLKAFYGFDEGTAGVRWGTVGLAEVSPGVVTSSRGL